MIGKPVLIISYLLYTLACISYCNGECFCSDQYIPQYYDNHYISKFPQINLNDHPWKPILQPKYRPVPQVYEHMQTRIEETPKVLKLESKPIITKPKLPEKKEEIKPVKEEMKPVKEEMKPVREEMKPVKEEMKPVKADEKSVEKSLEDNFKQFKQEIKEMKKNEKPMEEKMEEKPEMKNEQNIIMESKDDDKEDGSEEDEKTHHHHDKNAYYKFEYEVNDKKTKDVKHQKEELRGDKIVGEYSLLEEDGNVRTVKYMADWKNGFRAQVHNSKKKRYFQ